MKTIISGGGTGGHIFPAIAIANEIKRQFPQAEILFVGAKGRMEMEKVPQAGYPIKGLWISGLQRRITYKNLLVPIKILSSWLKAKQLMKRFKPDVVIGVGGYSSGPTLKAALSLHIPCVIQEQNSYPGITNKLLAKKAKIICTAYENMSQWFPKEKTFLTGNPVREMISKRINPQESRLAFGLEPNKPTVLVVGGSLGAKSINESIGNGLQQIYSAGLQLIWQTGKTYHAIAEDQINALQIEHVKTSLQAYPFITEIDKAYAAADIIVSRAGAIAISELCVVGKPVILVPSPHVAEDHQTKNATALTDKHAAIMVKDADAQERLTYEICTLAKDTEMQSVLAANILSLGIIDAAEKIVDLIKTHIVGRKNDAICQKRNK